MYLHALCHIVWETGRLALYPGNSQTIQETWCRHYIVMCWSNWDINILSQGDSEHCVRFLFLLSIFFQHREGRNLILSWYWWPLLGWEIWHHTVSMERGNIVWFWSGGISKWGIWTPYVEFLARGMGILTTKTLYRNCGGCKLEMDHDVKVSYISRPNYRIQGHLKMTDEPTSRRAIELYTLLFL